MGSKPRKLILHIDVNNTIFVGDSKTKLTALEGVLNEYLTEIVWGKVSKDGLWSPLDNPISTVPPSKIAISYYKYAEYKFEQAGKPRSEFKDHARRFTFEATGQRFRPYLEQVREKLKFPGTSQVVDANLDALVMKEEDGFYYRILPSYFKLLNHLLGKEREFSVVLRTFGGDGNIALKATQLYTENKHPDFTFPPGNELTVDPNPGRIVPSEDGLSVITTDGSTVSSCDKIYDIFSQTTGVQLYLDNYDWWKKNDFTSNAGKPLLIDPSDATVQHILFDDNIRSWEPTDNIVSLLVKKHGQFVHKDCKEFDGLCLLRTHLFESILNEDYFIEKVEMCEKKFNDYSKNPHCDLI